MDSKLKIIKYFASYGWDEEKCYDLGIRYCQSIIEDARTNIHTSTAREAILEYTDIKLDLMKEKQLKYSNNDLIL